MANNLSLWERVQTESPVFFKRITRGALTLSTISTTLVVASGNVPGFTLTPTMQQLCQYGIVAGLVAAAISKTTVNDSGTQPKPAAPNDAEIQNK
jgi:hypothetical protein